MEFPYKTKHGFTIKAVKDAKWTCPDKTNITCTLSVEGGVFGSGDTEIPFTAIDCKEEEHSRLLFKLLKKTATKYKEPEKSYGQLKDELDELMIDITLGLATDEELERAREIRTLLKGDKQNG